MKGFVAAASLVWSTAVFAEEAGQYLPLWQPKPPNITDLALIYQGGTQRPQWTRERYAPRVSYRDPGNGSQDDGYGCLFDSSHDLMFPGTATPQPDSRI